MSYSPPFSPSYVWCKRYIRPYITTLLGPDLTRYFGYLRHRQKRIFIDPMIVINVAFLRIEDPKLQQQVNCCLLLINARSWNPAIGDPIPTHHIVVEEFAPQRPMASPSVQIIGVEPVMPTSRTTRCARRRNGLARRWMPFREAGRRKSSLPTPAIVGEPDSAAIGRRLRGRRSPSQCARNCCIAPDTVMTAMMT